MINKEIMDALCYLRSLAIKVQGHEGVLESFKQVHSYIEKLERQPQEKWIPCTEELPKEEGLYLTSYMGYMGYTVQMNGYDPTDDLDFEWWIEELDAWMPLPEPYRPPEPTEIQDKEKLCGED